MITLKNTIFIRLFGLFPLSVFCFYLSNMKKKKKTKNAIFFSKTSFLTSPKFCKNAILSQCDTICVFINAQKTLQKWGENSEKQKTWTSFKH